MIVCGVDPAQFGGYYTLLDTDERRVREMGKFEISSDGWQEMPEAARTADRVVIERIRSFSFPASAATFDSQWNAALCFRSLEPHRRAWLYRTDVKLHLLGSTAGNNAGVTKVLYDRFGGDRKLAVGTKKSPGPCYGVTGDHWQALAVAVAWWERENRRMV